MDEKGFHVHVVGINHFDPLIPPRLSSHLQALAQEHSSPPAFVGVEYAKKVFLEIKAQRPRFRELLRNTWPEMTSKDLEILADSLAYEGDRHLAIFPDSPTLWLEIVRGVLPGTIENYAENRLAMYRERGGSDPSPARISQEIQRIAMDNFDLNRSATFAQTVLNGIRDLHGTWAITVTGSGHTRANRPGSMCQLLEASGVLCRTTVV